MNEIFVNKKLFWKCKGRRDNVNLAETGMGVNGTLLMIEREIEN